MSQSKREQVVSHLRYIRQELREMHQGIQEDGLLPDPGEVRGVMAQMEALLELVAGRSARNDSAFSRLLYQTAKHNGHHTFIAQFIAIIGSLPTTLLSTLAIILVTAVPAIYYTTDRCPEIFDIITRKPLRYALASFMFTISVVIGFLFFIIPGILVALMEPLYVYYVFTTDLDLTTCLSKAFKGMFQDFGSLFVVSLLSFLAVIISIVSIIFLIFIPSLLFLLSIIKIYSSASFLLSALLIFLSLAVLSIPMIVLSMRELYMQNYIHHKGLVRARELA